MYHITPKRNLESIFKYGLIPGKGRGLSRKKFTSVFLTDNPAHILNEQAGLNWIKRNSPVLLEVDVVYYRIIPAAYDYEYLCNETIKPKHICFVTECQFTEE